MPLLFTKRKQSIERFFMMFRFQSTCGTKTSSSSSVCFQINHVWRYKIMPIQWSLVENTTDLRSTFLHLLCHFPDQNKLKMEVQILCRCYLQKENKVLNVFDVKRMMKWRQMDWYRTALRLDQILIHFIHRFSVVTYFPVQTSPSWQIVRFQEAYEFVLPVSSFV